MMKHRYSNTEIKPGEIFICTEHPGFDRCFYDDGHWWWYSSNNEEPFNYSAGPTPSFVTGRLVEEDFPTTKKQPRDYFYLIGFFVLILLISTCKG